MRNLLVPISIFLSATLFGFTQQAIGSSLGNHTDPLRHLGSLGFFASTDPLRHLGSLGFSASTDPLLSRSALAPGVLSRSSKCIRSAPARSSPPLITIGSSNSNILSKTGENARAQSQESPARSSPSSNDDELTASFPVNGFTISNPSPVQGEPIKICASGDGQRSIRFNDVDYKLFPDVVNGKKAYTTILAVPATHLPGKCKIEYGETTKTITVRDAHFATQRLHLPREKNNFIASPGEREAMNKAKTTVSDVKHWHGTFQKPIAKCRMSSRFGLKRVVNGKLIKDYFHSGLDFAGGEGTAIHACAPGSVILAHTGWRLHGNCVAIDHGQGVISIYIHMKSVKVKEGDEVEAGQVLGAVGHTGRASGPHLHFSVYVNDVASNPEFWFCSRF